MKNSLAQKIIGMELAALDRWNNGDPSGFLEICADDVVYFDTVSEERIDGLENLREYYESLRGKVHVEKDDIINPKVQSVENMAVLTFNLLSYGKEKKTKWNCTEVYRKENSGQWKIISTHWSITKPEFK